MSAKTMYINPFIDNIRSICWRPFWIQGINLMASWDMSQTIQFTVNKDLHTHINPTAYSHKLWVFSLLAYLNSVFSSLNKDKWLAETHIIRNRYKTQDKISSSFHYATFPLNKRPLPRHPDLLEFQTQLRHGHCPQGFYRIMEETPK